MGRSPIEIFSRSGIPGIAPGAWQQIVLCDFDDHPREREVTVTVVGE